MSPPGFRGLRRLTPDAELVRRRAAGETLRALHAAKQSIPDERRLLGDVVELRDLHGQRYSRRFVATLLDKTLRGGGVGVELQRLPVIALRERLEPAPSQ